MKNNLPTSSTDGRIQSVDLIRLLAITAVIVIHTAPFKGVYEDGALQHLASIIDQSARFAVPFFFVISGYFFGVKVNSGSPPLPLSLNMARKLIILFSIWCVIYLLLPTGNIHAVIKHGGEAWMKGFHKKLEAFYFKDPLTFFFRGMSHHLWFFMALMWAALITGLFLHFKKTKALIALSVLLFALGLCAKAYSQSTIGLNLHFDTRNGPFFSTVLFVSGCLLAKYPPSTSWLKYGLLIMAGGYLLHFSEIWFLYQQYDTPWGRHDYVFGTYFMGMGAALIALSNHPALHIHLLSKIGVYTLGIYGVHRIFVEWLRRYDRQWDGPLWEIGYVFIVLFLSILSVWLLSKIKPLKKLLK